MKRLKNAFVNILPNLAFLCFFLPTKSTPFLPLKIILPQLAFSGYIIPLKWSKKWPNTHTLTEHCSF